MNKAKNSRLAAKAAMLRSTVRPGRKGKSMRLSKAERKPPGSLHGGRRRGAGRPPLGKVQMLIRLRKPTSKLLRQLAKKADLTPGEWLEANLRKLPAE